MNWLEIALAFGGFGTFTAVLTFLITIRYIKRKERAIAGQEEGKERQENLTAQKMTDEVYALMSLRLKEQFDGMNAEIKTLKDTQRGLLKTIEIQDGNIKHLQKTVNEYKETCDNCKFREEKITLKKIK
jgi:hypothetical protein